MKPINPYRRLESKSGLFLRDHPDTVRKDDVLVLAPLHNSGSRNDATGAFHPGARAFCRVHSIDPSTVFRFDNNRGRYAQADQVISEMERIKPRVLVAFCHGYQHGLQFGVRSPKHPRLQVGDGVRWERFCDALSAYSALGFAATTVVLFACSTGDDPDDDPDTAPGSGDGSFADLLRDDLCSRWATQCRVVSHTTAGHAWFNRDVKLFDGDGEQTGGIGAEMLAIGRAQRSRLAELLKTDWAFTFPFRSVSDIRAELY